MSRAKWWEEVLAGSAHGAALAVLIAGLGGDTDDIGMLCGLAIVLAFTADRLAAK